MADFYWQGVHSTNWTEPTAWVTASGGSTHPDAMPTSADPCYFESATSTANCVINDTTCVCGALNITTWAQTMSFSSISNILTVSGSITLGSSATYDSGTIGTLKMAATGTLTTNTKTIPWNFTISAAATITLAEDITISKTLSMLNTITFSGAYDITCVGLYFSTGGIVVTLSGNIDCNGSLTTDLWTGGNKGAITINGLFNINVSGNFTMSRSVAGTCTIIMDGTGTWGTGAVTNMTCSTNLTFNTAGTITIQGSYLGVEFSTGTLTYTAGTMSVTTSAVTVCTGAKLDTVGMSFYRLILSTGTVTLLDDVDVSEDLILGGGTANGNTIFVNNDISVSGVVTGTTNLVMDGTGTWSTATSSAIALDLEINTAGTITISGTVYYKTGVFIYTAGTVTTTGSTLNLQGECDLDVKDITWNNITFSVADSYNIVDGLTLSNTLACTASCSFDNMNIYGPPDYITITNGTTQTFAYFSVNDTTSENKCTIKSSTPGSYFTLSKSSGLVHLRNCIISDSHASGNGTWYAGEETCTDGGGNLKWIFHSPLMINYNSMG